MIPPLPHGAGDPSPDALEHLDQVLAQWEADLRRPSATGDTATVSLADVLRDGPLLPRLAAHLVERLARLLQTSHDQGRVHGSLRPAVVGIDQKSGEPRRPGAKRDVKDALCPLRLCVSLPGPEEIIHPPDDPIYLAPEQVCGGDPPAPAVDVYALGALLYECLAGRPPFRGVLPTETLAQVLDQEPPPIRRLQPKVPRDLEAICRKCLEKDPRRRYSSALALAEDLRRFLRGELVGARVAGPVERGWRWCSRHPVLSTGLTAAAAVLVLGAVAGVFLAVRAGEQARATARQAAQVLELARTEQQAKAVAVHERDAARRHFDRARRHLHAAHLLRLSSLLTTDPCQAHRLLSDEEACPPDLRDAAWHYCERRCRSLAACESPQPPAFAVLPGRWPGLTAAAFSPDGRWFASGDGDGTVRLWDMDHAREQAAFLVADGPVYALAFSSDGRELITAGPLGAISCWDLAGHATRNLSVPAAAEVTIQSVAFRGDGTGIAVGDAAGDIWLGDLRSRRLHLLHRGEPLVIEALTFSLDSRLLAWAESDGIVKVWDLATGKERATLHGSTGRILALAFSASGQTLASGSEDRTVRLWDAFTGQLQSVLTGPPDRVTGVVFRPRDRALLAGSGDGTMCLWDLGP